jgi:hypothetical protein
VRRFGKVPAQNRRRKHNSLGKCPEFFHRRRSRFRY